MTIASIEYIKECFDYNPITGKFKWKNRGLEHFKRLCAYKTFNNNFANREAFTANHKKGYKCGTILGNLYLAHRVAWAIYYGEWPTNIIDHINGNKFDNRINNLRQATYSQNSANSKLSKANTSGIKGVSFNKKLNKFCARIVVRRKQITLGYFENIEHAKNKYSEAAKKYFGEYANCA